jgi:hypothetical protein
MAENKIIARILKQYGISGFESLVNNMPLADLQSLLLELYDQRAKNITAKELLEQYKKNRFVQPSTFKLTPQDLLSFTQLALQLLPEEFASMDLSPVCPLGTTSVLAPLSQKTTLTTIRNTEVCSDVTNVLALHAAVQRKELLKNNENKFKRVKLCSSHRLLRAQLFANPLYSPHFQILSLCIAGRDQGDFKFELAVLSELIIYFYKLINHYVFAVMAEKARIKCIIFTHNQSLLDKLNALANQLSVGDDFSVTAKINMEENWNYYGQIRFNIFLCDKSSNEDLFIADGGDTNWTQKLVSDKKERYMISGLGSELFVQQVLELQKNRGKL